MPQGSWNSGVLDEMMFIERLDVAGCSDIAVQ
jgi:hypothetical protein